MRDWQQWHCSYEDPSSSLSRRLAVVRRHVSDLLGISRGYPHRVLSLCTGDGRDVSGPDIKTTVSATPGLLRDGGTVIWTRGSTKPDLRPSIRRWFESAGLQEIAFDSEPTGFGVGVAFKPRGVDAGVPIPSQLFRFIR